MTGKHHKKTSLEDLHLDDAELQQVAPEPEEEQENDGSEDKSNTNEIDNSTSNNKVDSTNWYINIIKGCRVVQKYSSYSFTAFLVLHAATVLSPVISLDLADQTLQFSKAVYQTAWVEPVVLGSIALHVGAGTLLRMNRMFRQYIHYERFQPLHMSYTSLAGYGLYGFVLVHFIINRAAPFFELGDSSLINLQFVSQQFHQRYILTWALYAPLVGLSAFHVISGWKVWLAGSYRGLLGRLASRIYKWSNWWIGMTGAVGMASLWVLSRVDRVSGWIGEQYAQVFTRLSY